MHPRMARQQRISTASPDDYRDILDIDIALCDLSVARQGARAGFSLRNEACRTLIGATSRLTVNAAVSPEKETVASNHAPRLRYDTAYGCENKITKTRVERIARGAM